MEEKAKRPRLPEFVINPRRHRAEAREVKVRLRQARLHTVCESARCPNLIECFARPTAAFLILGNRCARACGFCAVNKGRPTPLDPEEPEAVARAAVELKLRHVVVTSVTRDDLPDGGAEHFAKTIRALRSILPAARVEVLVPDFQGEETAVRTVLAAGPDVFNHNLETVPRLYPQVRPAADYRRSLRVLGLAAASGGPVLVKSGFMVGLGEEKAELMTVLADLAQVGCRLATIGQYLQPRRACLPVARYWAPEEYLELEAEGKKLGMQVFAGPLVRSSYLADQLYDAATIK